MQQLCRLTWPNGLLLRWSCVWPVRVVVMFASAQVGQGLSHDKSWIWSCPSSSTCCLPMPGLLGLGRASWCCSNGNKRRCLEVDAHVCMAGTAGTAAWHTHLHIPASYIINYHNAEVRRYVRVNEGSRVLQMEMWQIWLIAYWPAGILFHCLKYQ